MRRLPALGGVLLAGALAVGCGSTPAGTSSRVQAGAAQLDGATAPAEGAAPVLVRRAARPAPVDPVRSLQPAVSQMPAAGGCEEQLKVGEAVVELAADAPYPRCQVVRPDQQLRVVNATGRYGEPAATVVVTFAGYDARRLAPGESTVFEHALGELLAPGVHRLTTDLYNGSDAELWLKR